MSTDHSPTKEEPMNIIIHMDEPGVQDYIEPQPAPPSKFSDIVNHLETDRDVPQANLVESTLVANSPSNSQNYSRSPRSTKRVINPRASILMQDNSILVESSPKYSKAIFNSSTQLPKIASKNAHDFYRNKLDTGGERSAKSSLKMSKIPGYKLGFGSLSAPRSNKKRRISKVSSDGIFSSKLEIKESRVLESKYRRINLLASQPMLTKELYSKILEESQSQLRIENPEMPNFRPSTRAERDYLKKQLSLPKIPRAFDEDNEDKETVGLNAVNNFYKHYKILGKAQAQNESKKLKSSVYTQILGRETRQKLLPIKMDMIKRTGKPTSINVR